MGKKLLETAENGALKKKYFVQIELNQNFKRRYFYSVETLDSNCSNVYAQLENNRLLLLGSIYRDECEQGVLNFINRIGGEGWEQCIETIATGKMQTHHDCSRAKNYAVLLGMDELVIELELLRIKLLAEFKIARDNERIEKEKRDQELSDRFYKEREKEILQAESDFMEGKQISAGLFEELFDRNGLQFHPRTLGVLRKNVNTVGIGMIRGVGKYSSKGVFGAVRLLADALTESTT